MKLLPFSLFLSIAFVGLTVISSCKKEDIGPIEPAPGEVVEELKFDSLYFEGEVVIYQDEDIYALASGKDITYTWTIDIGVLLGSGNTVTFTACCQGFHNITCTVEDAYGNSITKEIMIKVV